MPNRHDRLAPEWHPAAMPLYHRYNAINGRMQKWRDQMAYLENIIQALEAEYPDALCSLQ